ncbi:MAG: nucleoside 2-deoxyribosyltransferase [Chloroflexi bacterium]|nr:nucleoside 2-deoxyribosyltransferase [Chloroflexota bacterium]
MNIYFACSITGGREFERVYQDLMAALLSDGHQIPTAHLADSNVLAMESVIAPREVYDRDVTWIQSANALIAEVSAPSHGVGFEIGFALQAEKPVLCLYQAGRKVSKMITGNPNPKLSIKEYKDSEEAVLFAREFILKLHSGSEVL